MFFERHNSTSTPNKGGVAWTSEAFIPAIKPPRSQQAKRKLPPIAPKLRSNLIPKQAQS